jgi:hypothetical protein
MRFYIPLAAAGRRDEFEAEGTRPSVYLKWIDAFETGSSDIDALHRELIRNCNGLLFLIDNDAAWALIPADLQEHREIPRSLAPALVDVIIRHDLDFRSHLLQQQGR